MRSFFLSLILATICFASTITYSYSQSGFPRSNVVSLSVGYSLFRFWTSDRSPRDYINFVRLPNIPQANYCVNPTFQFSQDARFSKLLSLGYAISYNHLSASDVGVEYRLNRTYLGTRALLHYYDSEKFTTYFGARAGLAFWSFNSSNVNSASGSSNSSDTFFNLQIIPFGYRGYMSKKVGIGFETAIGGPYFINLSFLYRFNLGKQN